MSMNLMSPFMMSGTKMPYELKQTCIFQLLDCLSVYDLLLPFGMKVLKAKTVHKTKWIDKGYSIFNLFRAFVYKTYNIVFMFKIFHPQSNAGFNG